VLYFPSRAAYLASFLSDASGNRAWGKWYYTAFQGLKHLPASALVRTVVCEQPGIGEEALRQLNETELKNVLRSLTAADARLILERVAEKSSDSDEFTAFEFAWNALAPSLLEYLDFGGEWQSSLRLYLAASQGTGGGIVFKTAVLALLRLAKLLVDGSGIQKEALVEGLARGEMTILYAIAGAANAECIAPLLRCPSDWVKEVGLTLMARVTGSPLGKTEEPPVLRLTSFGGIFLLLPILDEWPLAKAAHSWPDAEEIPPAAILRLLILAKCCGQSRAQGVFHDNLILDLLGIPPDFSIETLGRWQKDISACHFQAFLDVLSDWLSQRGAIDGNKLILCLATPIAVLLDGARGIWLAAEEFSPSSPKGLPDALYTWMDRGAPKDKSIEESESAQEAPCCSATRKFTFRRVHPFPIHAFYVSMTNG
jgi:hypothetical protein